MGASSKRKKEKAKDFQKPKLRVGKTKPKADNYTETSFASKRINLSSSHLSAAAPSTSSQITRHLSLLKTRSSSQRHDSLAYLTNLPTAQLSDAAPTLLPKLPSLLHDESPAVRTQLLKLLHRLPTPSIHAQTESLALWTRAGLTHLSTDIQLSSLSMLNFLLEIVGEDLFAFPGAWTGFLNTFCNVLSWKEKGASQASSRGWSSMRSGSGAGSSSASGGGKLSAKRLLTFTSLLSAGLSTPVLSGDVLAADNSIHAQLKFIHGIPRRGNAYAHLNLFGPPADDEHQIHDDPEERGRVFKERFATSVKAGVKEAMKEGGETGRAGSKLSAVVEGAMREGG